MELLQLKYFTAAAECENFSMTARRFRVPTSDISQTVKRLEKELGAPLFDRTSNRLRLNSAGKILYEAASRALSTLDEAGRQIRELESGFVGELRLLVETDRRIVTAAIEKFRAEYPEVSFTVDFSSGEGEYDLIISDTPPIGNYTATPFISEPIRLAVSSASPYASRESLTLSDLSGARFIGMGRDSRLQALVEQVCRSAGFLPNTVISTPDPYYVRRFVEMGMGVALVPAISWAGLFSGATRLLDIGNFTRESFIFTPKSSFSQKLPALFTEALTAQATSEP